MGAVDRMKSMAKQRRVLKHDIGCGTEFYFAGKEFRANCATQTGEGGDGGGGLQPDTGPSTEELMVRLEVLQTLVKDLMDEGEQDQVKASITGAASPHSRAGGGGQAGAGTTITGSPASPGPNPMAFRQRRTPLPVSNPDGSARSSPMKLPFAGIVGGGGAANNNPEGGDYYDRPRFLQMLPGGPLSGSPDAPKTQERSLLWITKMLRSVCDVRHSFELAVPSRDWAFHDCTVGGGAGAQGLGLGGQGQVITAFPEFIHHWGVLKYGGFPKMVESTCLEIYEASHVFQHPPAGTQEVTIL